MISQVHDGSAKLALETSPPFGEFIFVEIDPLKCKELEQLKEQYPHKAHRIKIINDDANDSIDRICDIFYNSSSSKRGVIFVDPFALSFSWRSIEKIAATKCLDMWYLFPIAAVNRLLTIDGAKLPDSWVSKLKDTFGDLVWKSSFYTSKENKSLFGQNETKIMKTTNFQQIAEYLLQRLESVFAGVADNPIFLTNSQNSPLFLLCFACGNENGKDLALRISRDILKKAKKVVI